MQHVLFELLVIFVLLAFLALVIGLFTFLPILRRTLVPLSSISIRCSASTPAILKTA